jgi:hypothetical protein
MRTSFNGSQSLRQTKTFYNQGLAVSKQLITQFEKYHIRTKLISLYKDMNEKARSARP